MGVHLTVNLLVIASALLTAAPGFASNFGTEGSDGSNGRPGRPGSDGSRVTVVVDGSMRSVNTAGMDGAGAERGYEGQDAYNCYWGTDPAYNLQGARGGHGGSGGEGGTGGNAGNVTFYVTSLAALKNVSVNAAGGRGGPGGWGGNESNGCRCSKYSWTVEDQTYYCQDGERGERGNTGNSGRAGSSGTAFLIEQTAPLPPTTPAIATNIDNLLSGDQHLSRELWTTQRGAAALFARGSTIADNWYKFDRIQESTVTFDWNAIRAVEEFKNVEATLNFGAQNPEASFDTSKSWLIANQQVSGDDLHIDVTAAILTSEVKALTFQNASGHDRQLQLNLQDASGLPPELETTWHLHYYTRGLVFWKLRFDGAIPPELVHINGEDVSIDIGRLDIQSNFLTQGTQFQVELTATRKFGPHSTTVVFEKSLRVP